MYCPSVGRGSIRRVSTRIRPPTSGTAPGPHPERPPLRTLRIGETGVDPGRRVPYERTGWLAPAASVPQDAASASRQAEVDQDAARLLELGYEQELRRRLGGIDNVAMGFATISPVVGLYAVVLVGTLVAGPAWLWVLPIALAGQCLLLVVYSELSAEFPITGGAYQWGRRLLGGAYGRDRRRGDGSRGNRSGAAARLPRAGLLDPDRDARRGSAVGRLGWRGAAGGAGGGRLGVHRFRRLRRLRRGNQIGGPARSASGLAFATERCGLGDPQRVRRRARPPRSSIGRRGPGCRSGHHGRCRLVRLVVDQAVRGGGADRLPGLRHGGGGSCPARGFFDRPRRGPTRVWLPSAGGPARNPDRR